MYHRRKSHILVLNFECLYFGLKIQPCISIYSHCDLNSKYVNEVKKTCLLVSRNHIPQNLLSQTEICKGEFVQLCKDITKNPCFCYGLFMVCQIFLQSCF